MEGGKNWMEEIGGERKGKEKWGILLGLNEWMGG